MATVTYRIHSGGDGWIVAENGADGASYVTREAAFEAATMAAMNVLKLGDGVVIEIAPTAADAPALGPR
jgi:hypothetical protein